MTSMQVVEGEADATGVMCRGGGRGTYGCALCFGHAGDWCPLSWAMSQKR